MRKKEILLACFGVVSLMFLTSCSLMRGAQGTTVKIAAQNTTESSIMANMIVQLIEHESDNQATLVSNLDHQVSLMKLYYVVMLILRQLAILEQILLALWG